MNYVISIINPRCACPAVTHICAGTGPAACRSSCTGTAPPCRVCLTCSASNQPKSASSFQRRQRREDPQRSLPPNKHRLHIGVPGHGIVDCRAYKKHRRRQRPWHILNGDQQTGKACTDAELRLRADRGHCKRGLDRHGHERGACSGRAGRHCPARQGHAAQTDAPKFYNVSIAERKGSWSSSSLPRQRRKSAIMSAKSCARHAGPATRRGRDRLFPADHRGGGLRTV